MQGKQLLLGGQGRKMSEGRHGNGVGGCKWGLGGMESLARRIEIGPGACYLLLLLMGGLLPSSGDLNF